MITIDSWKNRSTRSAPQKPIPVSAQYFLVQLIGRVILLKKLRIPTLLLTRGNHFFGSKKNPKSVLCRHHGRRITPHLILFLHWNHLNLEASCFSYLKNNSIYHIIKFSFKLTMSISHHWQMEDWFFLYHAFIVLYSVLLLFQFWSFIVYISVPNAVKPNRIVSPNAHAYNFRKVSCFPGFCNCVSIAGPSILSNEGYTCWK